MDTSTPPQWSLVGEENLSKAIQLAERGNVRAGKFLVAFVGLCLAADQPLPEVVRRWFSARLMSAAKNPSAAARELRLTHKRGRPPEHADDIRAAFEHEALKDRAAWAAFWELRSGTPYAPNQNRDSAFQVIGQWLANQGHRFSDLTIRDWYDERRAAMEAEAAKIQAMLEEL
jgi:hypothetical protein